MWSDDLDHPISARAFFIKMSLLIYSNDDLITIDKYKVKKKVNFANTRFKDDNITVSDVLNVLKMFNLTCFYCKEKLDSKTWQLDHFFSKANGGKNLPNNIIASCKWCNIMKNSLDGNSFLIRCKKIVISNLKTEIPDSKNKNKTVPLDEFQVKIMSLSGNEDSNKRKVLKYVTEE